MKLPKRLYDDIARGGEHKFYISTLWRKKRKEILKRDNNECQRCKGKGKFKLATCVHHIKHLKARLDLALVNDNLISL